MINWSQMLKKTITYKQYNYHPKLILISFKTINKMILILFKTINNSK